VLGLPNAADSFLIDGDDGNFMLGSSNLLFHEIFAALEAEIFKINFHNGSPHV
jgi:hypothetical protein